MASSTARPSLMSHRTALEEGVDIIDIGGESTRPGALPVDATEERRRVLPAIRAAVEAGAVVSIDTRKAEVARAALAEGACIVNDVSGLSDPSMASAAAEADAWLVLMHSHGVESPDDPLPEIARDLAELASGALQTGVPREKLIIDPGLGFAEELADQSPDRPRPVGSHRARPPDPRRAVTQGNDQPRPGRRRG